MKPPLALPVESTALSWALCCSLPLYLMVSTGMLGIRELESCLNRLHASGPAGLAQACRGTQKNTTKRNQAKQDGPGHLLGQLL